MPNYQTKEEMFEKFPKVKRYYESREQRKQHRLYNIEHSLCLQCSQPAITGQRFCRMCRDKAREKSKMRKGTEGRIQTCSKYYQSHKRPWRNYYYQKKYGITLEKYEEMFKRQSGRCEICKSKPEKSRNLHIDHDKTTGKVRGLLCTNCNTALGGYRENIQILKAVIRYIKKYNHIKEEIKNENLPMRQLP